MLDFHLGGGKVLDTGYPSTLSQFSTAIRLSFPGYVVGYFKVGTFANQDITWVDGSKYAITSNSITNFTSTAAGPLSYHVSNWQTTGSADGVNWVVSSPSPTVKAPELPEEIRTMHPLLNFANLKHYETNFFVSGDTYEKYLDRTIMGGTDTGPIERMYVSRYSAF